MDLRYVLSSATPLLIVFLISSILVFASVFISSISSAIDRIIVLLGSSSLTTTSAIPYEVLPDGAYVDEVRRGEGILYSANGESLVYLKGVDEGYFNIERKEGLRLETAVFEDNWIVISSNLAKVLDVGIGNRMTLLLYEEEKGRTRPFLLTVVGIFDSGYAQLDRYLAFLDISMVQDRKMEYEILLPVDSDIDKVQADLIEQGYNANSYKSNYAALYSNVQQSIMILYVILASIAVLSGFFSIDVALVYLSRDRADIATMKLLGLGRKSILRVYMKMTLLSIMSADLLGILLGIALGYLSPRIVEALSHLDSAMMEYYITSFAVRIPYKEIGIMIILMLFFAFISLIISLRHYDKEELLLLVNNG